MQKSSNPLLLSVLFALSFVVVACQSPGPQSALTQSNTKNEAPSRPLVDPKYTLTQDRQELDQLRKEVPPEKKQENDEIAFSLSLFSEVKRPPSEIRDRFDHAVAKRRDLFNKDMSKVREDYEKSEHKARDSFTENLDKEREQFKKEKHGRQEVSDFYRDQDEKRKDYFTTEREHRSEFESDMRDKRHDFEDYMHEKTNDFNQEYRAYTRKYDEMQKKKNESESKSP